MVGKSLRLKRFFSKDDGRLVLFPLDHGVTCGPVPGIRDLSKMLRIGTRAGVDGFVLHKGMMSHLASLPCSLPGIFMHLSASTQLGPHFHWKVGVGSVEEAIQRGADGVSVHVNLGDNHEPDMLRELGEISGACCNWGMPLLVMIYVRGDHAPKPVPDEAIAHAARVAAELGADIIKIPCPRNLETLGLITGCVPVPVVTAGGAKDPDPAAFLHRIEEGLKQGVRGVAVGRNVFQHRDAAAFLKSILDVIHRRHTAEEAAARLQTGETR